MGIIRPERKEGGGQHGDDCEAQRRDEHLVAECVGMLFRVTSRLRTSLADCTTRFAAVRSAMASTHTPVIQ
jgi:hypothetical protein